MHSGVRRHRIAELIRSRPIASQQELVEALSATGDSVTQATVSRDLRAMGVVKGPKGYLPPENGIAIAGPNGTAAGAGVGSGVGPGVLSIEPADSIVVIRTPVGLAGAVGVMLDRLRPNGMVGCVAGDDTLFLATAGKAEAKRLRRVLADHFKVKLND